MKQVVVVVTGALVVVVAGTQRPLPKRLQYLDGEVVVVVVGKLQYIKQVVVVTGTRVVVVEGARVVVVGIGIQTRYEVPQGEDTYSKRFPAGHEDGAEAVVVVVVVEEEPPFPGKWQLAAAMNSTSSVPLTITYRLRAIRFLSTSLLVPIKTPPPHLNPSAPLGLLDSALPCSPRNLGDSPSTQRSRPQELRRL